MIRSNQTFRPDIEGLRAIAIILVVACHCGVSLFAGGFVGVDVFFTLSGYLITGLLLREYQATGQISLPEFYSRRARRLLPACALVVMVTMLGAAALYTPQEIDHIAHTALFTALYASNLYFDRNASDYFSPDVTGNPLLHTWSLGLEEQFYLIWPLLLLSILWSRMWGHRLIWILAAVGASSLICCLYATRLLPTFGFYELPARAWEFALGGVLALLPASAGAAKTRWTIASGVIGVGVILASAVTVRNGAAFPGWIALCPVIGTLGVIYAGAHVPTRGVSALLSTAPFQYVGSRSYSWYLWHWPLIVFASVLFPGITVGGKTAAAGAALLAAAVTFILVERPVRESSYLSARTGLMLGAIGGVAILSVAASWGLLIFAQQQRLLDQRYQAIEAASATVGDISQKCWSAGGSFEARLCEFGPQGASRTLVLYGDSHALQWINPMRTLVKQESWRLVTVVRPGCAASDINPHKLVPNRCSEWRSDAIAEIIQMRPFAVVMSSFNGQTVQNSPDWPMLMSTEEVRIGTRRIVEELSNNGIPVVVLRDTPVPPFNIPVCVTRHLADKLGAGKSCDFHASLALNTAAFAAEKSAVEGLPDVYTLDMDDIICPSDPCTVMQREVLVYRDQDHLTDVYAETLEPVLRARLLQLLANSRLSSVSAGLL